MRYPLIIHPPDADGVVTIELDGLPGVTEGDSLEEALANVPDMVWTAAAGRVANGFDLPAPPPDDGRPTAAVPAIIVLKYELRLALDEAGVARSELARRLGVPRQRVTRLLDPAHNSRIAQLEAALEALGREVVVDVRRVA
jgi:antitoxin HicB